MTCDLRALLYEPYYRYVDDAVDFAGAAAEAQGETRHDPLATRLPGCVPPGLTYQKYTRTMECERWELDRHPIGWATAELLFIGQAMKVLHAAEKVVQAWQDDLPAALAAALHRLADEKGGA